MAVRGPGDLIGELSAIDGGPRSGTVTTLEPAEALLVPGSAFAGLLERRPRIALVILRMVAGRLRYADSQQTQFATHDVVGRVAQRLVELGERFGEREGDRIEIALPLSQEELASWTGSSREAVSKALQQLRSLDIVATGRRHITRARPGGAPPAGAVAVQEPPGRQRSSGASRRGARRDTKPGFRDDRWLGLMLLFALTASARWLG